MKLLHLDIETSPVVAYVWRLFGQDIGVDQIITPTSLLCWAAKWHGEKEIYFAKSGGTTSGSSFEKMVRQIHSLLSEADAVCHFNGNSFDMPRLNQEFLLLGLAPPPPVPNIDLKNVIMRKFDMTSSKLAFVGPYLDIGGKVKHEGWDLWKACLAGDKDAWARMEKYNKQDVVLLEKLYSKVLPWIDQHPNMTFFVDSAEPVCPNCGSLKLQKRGVSRATTQVYIRYQCQDCGRWSRARQATKQSRGLVKVR